MYDKNSDWFEKYYIGVLQIYLDDFEFPILSTLVNMG